MSVCEETSWKRNFTAVTFELSTSFPALWTLQNSWHSRKHQCYNGLYTRSRHILPLLYCCL